MAEDTPYTPPPSEFGAPPKFKAWREGQEWLFWNILDADTRFDIHNAPVGMGKSVSYAAAAFASDKRIAILTESKGLQDQLAADFGAYIFDMRGLQNYKCHAMDKGGFYEGMWRRKWGRPTCDHGPCTGGIRCDLKQGGCDYFDAYRQANASRIVSTNYAYWIAIHKYGQGLGKFDWLVLDEAHAAPDALTAAMSVEFTQKDFKELKTQPPRKGSPIANWKMWGRVQLQRVQGRLEFFTHSAKVGTVDESGAAMFVSDTDAPDASELRFWKNLEGKCKTISESQDDWVIDFDNDTDRVRVAPIWIKKHAEENLFLNIPRVTMTSATVRPKTADLLGLTEYRFTEYPSTFPLERRPIWWIPTVKLNKDSTQSDLQTMVARLDQIIGRYARMGLKGIVHTISYPRQRFILENSHFRDIMHANLPGTTRDTVKGFKDAKGAAVLVSPSVGTGWDFPYDHARFQVIVKVPFRDMRGAVLTAQKEADPSYPDYLVSQDLLQMYGRINRAPDDCGHTWVIDDWIEPFVRRNKVFFPEYFLDAFQPIESIGSVDSIIGELGVIVASA